MRLLLDLLAANGVVEERHGDVLLADRFRRALRYRDLLEVRLDYAGHVLRDFAEGFTTLLRDPAGFRRGATLFDLFDYRHALLPDQAGLERTRAWMRITTVLTRHEAGPCLDRYDIGAHRRVLDVGGNSGEFLRRICQAHAEVTGDVLDLPLVCDIGLDAMLAAPEAPRIGFIRADLRHEALPGGHDLITFKSMLHDWPERQARDFLARALAALPPGGTLLIYERAALRPAGPMPIAMLPNLLFFRSYRTADDYVAMLDAVGFTAVGVDHIALDSPFLLITAQKPGDA
jgi:SAM-dependent methyltransferase